MADSTLRMKIVTALDNAGLKATDQQLNILEKSISKVNAVGGKTAQQMGRQVNDLAQVVGGGVGNWLRYVTSITKVTSAGPGVMGALRGIGAAIKGVWTSLGPIGWAVLAIMGLKKAWDMVSAAFSKISNFGLLRLPEMLKEKWDAAVNYIKGIPARIKDTWDELWAGTSKGKEAKQAFEDEKKRLEDHTKAVEAASKKKMELMKKEEDEHQKVIDAIKRETQAYLQQAQTLQNLKSSKNDAEVLWLEGEKFRQQQAYEAAGQYEAAEQIGLAYDFEIQKTKARHEIEAAQQENRKALKAYNDSERQAIENTNRADKLEKDLKEAYARREKIKYDYQHQLDWTQGNDRITDEERKQIIKERRTAYYSDLKQVNDDIKNFKKQYEDTVKKEWTSHNDMWSNYGKVAELQQREANIRKSADTAVRMAAWSYDKTLDQNGNAANIMFDPQYLESIKDVLTDDKYQMQTAENTARMIEIWEQVLQMKE